MSKIYGFIVLIFITTGNAMLNLNPNTFVDNLLKDMKKNAMIHHYDNVDVPDYKAKYNKLLVSGSIKLKQGKMRGLETAQRVGEARVSLPNDNLIIVDTRLTFENLEIFFRRYDLEIIGLFKQSGEMTMRVNNNEFQTSITINKSKGRCNMVISIQVTEFGDADIQMTGTPIPMAGNPAFSLFAKWYTMIVSDWFKDQANTFFRNFVDKITQDENLCNNLLNVK